MSRCSPWNDHSERSKRVEGARQERVNIQGVSWWLGRVEKAPWARKVAVGQRTGDASLVFRWDLKIDDRPQGRRVGHWGV